MYALASLFPTPLGRACHNGWQRLRPTRWPETKDHIQCSQIGWIYLSWKYPGYMGFPGGSDGKEPACKVGDLGLFPGLGRSLGRRYGNPLQCSCLENPHGQRSLEGYSPRGHKEPGMTDRLSRAQASVWPFVLAALGFMRELGNTFWVMIQGVKNHLCNYYKPMTGSVYPATTVYFRTPSPLLQGPALLPSQVLTSSQCPFALVSGPL